MWVVLDIQAAKNQQPNRTGKMTGTQ